MECNVCHKVPACVHVIDVRDLEIVEKRHLCSHCAENDGYIQPKATALKISPEMLEDLLGSMQSGAAAGSQGAGSARGEGCAACGMTLAQFRNKGRLGCPRCYDTFRAALLPLLERVHDARAHKGRCPGTMARLAGEDDRLAELRSSLRDAIENENYELAARLRDEIASRSGRREDLE